MTKKQFEAKNYLSTIREYKRKINEEVLKVEELESYINFTKKNFDIKVDGGKDKATLYNERIARFIEEKSKINNRVEVYKREIKKVVDVIECLKDKRMREILLFRYNECLKWNEVSKKMKLTMRYTLNLHLEALDHVANLVVD